MENVDVYVSGGTDMFNATQVLTGPIANQTVQVINQWFTVDFKESFIVVIKPKPNAKEFKQSQY